MMFSNLFWVREASRATCSQLLHRQSRFVTVTASRGICSSYTVLLALMKTGAVLAAIISAPHYLCIAEMMPSLENSFF